MSYPEGEKNYIYKKQTKTVMKHGGVKIENRETNIEKVLKEAAIDGVIKCQKCGASLEPDCPECGQCGWINPLVEMGLI